MSLIKIIEKKIQDFKFSTLLDELNDENIEIREITIEKLGSSGDQCAFEPLFKHFWNNELLDYDENVSYSGGNYLSISALCKINKSKTIETLLDALKNEDFDISHE
jgi:hypothetical protein